MHKNNRGTTLIELLVAVAIIGVIVTISGIATLRQIDKSRMKVHEAEALAAYHAVIVYMDDMTSRGAVDDFTVYGDIMAYPLADKHNKLYDLLYGICPKDAKITRIATDRKKTKVTAIVYKAGIYEVEIRNGRVDTSRKL